MISHPLLHARHGGCDTDVAALHSLHGGPLSGHGMSKILFFMMVGRATSRHIISTLGGPSCQLLGTRIVCLLLC